MKAKGVSMVELLVVLAIASILAAAAAPSFAGFLAAQRLRLSAQALSESLSIARLAAISRGETVAVAPVDGSWEKGWMVFPDLDGDGQRGDGEELIAQQGAPVRGTRIAMGFSLPDRDGYIAYAPSGRSCRAGAPELPRWGTLTIAHGASKRRIKVSFLGRHRSCNPEVERAGCEGPEA